MEYLTSALLLSSGMAKVGSEVEIPGYWKFEILNQLNTKSGEIVITGVHMS